MLYVRACAFRHERGVVTMKYVFMVLLVITLVFASCSARDVDAGEDVTGDAATDADIQEQYDYDGGATERSTSIKGLLGLGKAMHCSYRQDMNGMTARQD